jgi:hypothetical protein
LKNEELGEGTLQDESQSQATFEKINKDSMQKKITLSHEVPPPISEKNKILAFLQKIAEAAWRENLPAVLLPEFQTGADGVCLGDSQVHPMREN